MQISQDTSNYLKNEISYVSGSDGQIFFNNVLLDECFDIQYMYREMKEPVYGYRDTYFSAMLPGTVILTGQFSINYIHDAYLYTILGAGKLTPSSTSIGGGNINSKQPATSFSKGGATKNKLEQYNDLRKKVDANKTDLNNYNNLIAQYEAQLADIQKQRQNNQDVATNTLSNLSDQEDAYRNSLWYNSSERLSNAEADITKYNNGLTEYNNNKDIINSADNDISYYAGLSFSLSQSIQSQASTILNKLSTLATMAQDQDEDQTANADDVQELVSQLYSLNEQYLTEVNRYVEPGFFDTTARDLQRFNVAKGQANASYTQTDAQLNEKAENIKDLKNEAEIKKSNIEKLEKQLAQLKSDLSKPNVSRDDFVGYYKNGYKTLDALSYLKAKEGNVGYSSTNNMPDPIYDTMSKPVQIDFVYNNIAHKRLVDVYLVGYNHELGIGGNPIREIYTFVAKRVIPL